MLYVIYDINDEKPKKFPLLLTQLHNILNISNRHEFIEWYNLSFSTHPWIPHIFLTLTHNVIRSHAAVAKLPKYQEAYSKGILGRYTTDILREVNKPYDYLVSAIDSVGVHDTGAFFWNQMPVSWRLLYPHIVEKW